MSKSISLIVGAAMFFLCGIMALSIWQDLTYVYEGEATVPTETFAQVIDEQPTNNIHVISTTDTSVTFTYYFRDWRSDAYGLVSVKDQSQEYRRYGVGYGLMAVALAFLIWGFAELGKPKVEDEHKTTAERSIGT